MKRCETASAGKLDEATTGSLAMTAGLGDEYQIGRQTAQRTSEAVESRQAALGHHGRGSLFSSASEESTDPGIKNKQTTRDGSDQSGRIER